MRLEGEGGVILPSVGRLQGSEALTAEHSKVVKKRLINMSFYVIQEERGGLIAVRWMLRGEKESAIHGLVERCGSNRGTCHCQLLFQAHLVLQW